MPDRSAPVAEAFVVEYKDSEKPAGKHFKLRWRGRDSAAPGVAPAGIESYRVFARRGHGRYRLVVKTRDNLARFTGNRGSRYSFYIQARDRAGNLEQPPRTADFVIRVRRA